MRLQITVLLLGLTGSLAATAARGQEAYPRSAPGRFEVDGLDFRPGGAWRQLATRIRANRNRLLRSGALSALNGRGAMTRVTGTYFVPVIPVTFQHVPAPFPAAEYQDVLFDPSPTSLPYSVRSYYAEA